MSVSTFFNTNGIDTIGFITTFSALTKKLDELGLEVKDRSRNYIINQYFYEKEIKQHKDRQVWFVEIGNTNNLSGYIIIKSNEDSISVSKKGKHSKTHYVEVVFAGLRQPTKDIRMGTYAVLGAFIKRFKVSYVDVCFDGACKKPIDKRIYFNHALESYKGKNSTERLVETSFYINNPSAPNIDADYFDRIIVYDKYIKESRNNKKLDTSLQYWKRIEFRVGIDAKLKDTNGLEEYLDDMARVAKQYFGVLDMNDTYLKQQVLWLTDKRTQRGKIL
ncbi:MAG: hypothetical protein QG567_1359 [Campylobacterota bacterium]|nr:hypothetical protein [Campylobacterota bacterium]